MALVTLNRRPSFANSLLRRELRQYPGQVARYSYLAIVVLTTVVLYYLYYVEGAVLPLLLPSYHMSFRFFLYLVVVSNAIGAFTAFIGGLSDVIGRANLTIVGTLLVGLVQLAAIPNIHSKFGFSVAYCIIGFAEGVILVSTPALMRDFSPQVGRGTAMGMWALGPTMGALAASLVATHTLPHLGPWQDQFIISGVVCLIVVVISFLFLRELSPALRDQLMVSERERALVEARARGIDIERSVAHPLKTMFRLDLIASATGISLFLLFYYASVSVLTLYWVVVFRRSIPDANGINVWYAAVLSGALIVFGLLSDRLRVRKPFMIAGALATIVMMIFLVLQVDQPGVGYYSNVLVISLLAIAIGCAYAPWMASYTEQVEHHNPALSATGLAIFGWTLRVVVAISFLVLPQVITTSTVLVDNQQAATVLQTVEAAAPFAPGPSGCAAKRAPSELLLALHATGEPGPQTLGTLIATCDRTHSLGAALQAAGGLSNPQVLGLLAFNPLAQAIANDRSVSTAEIQAKVGVHSQDLAKLLLAERQVVPAGRASPGEWKRWWYVCIGGQVIFAALVFAVRGRWSPRAAKEDLDAHQRLVNEELAKLAA